MSTSGEHTVSDGLAAELRIMVPSREDILAASYTAEDAPCRHQLVHENYVWSLSLENVHQVPRACDLHRLHSQWARTGRFIYGPFQLECSR